VLCFTQGSQALERIRADAGVEALIADAGGTPISGLELCWETRLMAGRKRPIYVLLIASSDDQRIWIEALDCGADDVINKPPLTDELYAKLRVAERVVTLQRDLIQLATRDPLTGVHNRRAFFEEATDACRDANSGGRLSAILLDIDRFKAINDHYGHDVGDDALQAVASEAARDGSIVGRLGGDEFSVLLRGYDLSGAVEVAEDLRERLARLRIPSRDGILSLTCSLGTSELELGDTVDDLMKRSDLALYRAKDEGRNRVATPPTGAWLSQRPRQAVSLFRSIGRQPPPANETLERRKGQPPSDAVLARICVVVDLLVEYGLSEEGAAQVMMRRMIAAGVSAPKKGTAPTGWKRLLAWKADFQNGLMGDEATREFENFAASIESIPPHERVERVLEGGLWNRRQGHRGAERRPTLSESGAGG